MYVREMTVEPYQDESKEKEANEENTESENPFRGLKVALSLGSFLGSFPFSVTGPGVTIAFSWRSIPLLWTSFLFVLYAIDAVVFFLGLARKMILFFLPMPDLSRGMQAKTDDLEAQGNSGISAEIIAIQRVTQRLFYLTVIASAMAHREALARAITSVSQLARTDLTLQRDLLCGYFTIQTTLLSTFFALNRSLFRAMSWSQWILFIIHKMVTTNALAFYAPLYALHARVLARSLFDLKLDLEGYRVNCFLARARYREIRDAVRSLNEGFGLVIIMLHGYIAYTLVEQLYLMASLADNSESINMAPKLGSALTSASRIAVDIAILLIINWPAQRFLDRDMELRERVTDMESYEDTGTHKRESSAWTSTFKFQSGGLGSIEKNQQMVLTAAGYLNLGKRLIMKAFGTVVSYTVLLVQFRQAEIVRGAVQPCNR
ncbi:unnamed protein product [Darwinula stevensoni]|uniref:Gustatory receptor n=1 Tax=Darwinula stevensoni TaxID=69355 RepID=A0A7R9A823_9CRUS|nr:unnamed protein product [Darwinula stevensoni]CAG0894646.1 unnamed protein product [Darwinula stevensoni]